MKTKPRRSSGAALCLFEDERAADLAPLSLLRPVFEIKTGAATLCEKIERHFHAAVAGALLRPYLSPNGGRSDAPALETYETPVLFVNGRLVCDGEFATAAAALPVNAGIVSGGAIVAMRLDAAAIRTHYEPLRALQFTPERYNSIQFSEISLRMLDRPWDAIRFHEEELRADLRAHVKNSAVAAKTFPGTALMNRKNIRIGARTRVYPAAVLNAERGEIVIEHDCTIYPQVYIEGPCFIGANSVLKAHASVARSSIGTQCRVAGEIGASIFHAFVNKQHEGFIGHSYFMPWVNVGAGTITSNLKNNYGMVTLDIKGVRIETGMQFLGTIAGDHVKFGINTMLNTGTLVGAGCNIFGGDFPPKYIPPFQWGGARGFETFEEERLIALARTAMARRNETLSSYQERVLRHAYRLNVPLA